MQQADEAVSKRNEVHESEYTARYSVWHNILQQWARICDLETRLF
jgi:hypothetical protein